MTDGAAIRLNVNDTVFKQAFSLATADFAHRKNVCLQRMGAHMLRSVALNFSGKGRHDGASNVWPALAESTIRGRKKGQRKRPMPLVATGVLKNSISWRIPKESTLDVGTNVPYAGYHQQDGNFNAKAGDLPARPFLVFHVADLSWFEKEVAREFGGKS